MTTITTIDLNWTGRPRSIAAVLIESEGASVLIDSGPASTLETLRAGANLLQLIFAHRLEYAGRIQ